MRHTKLTSRNRDGPKQRPSRASGSRAVVPASGSEASLNANRKGRDYAELDIDDQIYVAGQRSTGGLPSSLGKRLPITVEDFLTTKTTTAAYKRLQGITMGEAQDGEEVILRRWEEWNSRMGAQLSLESMVPEATHEEHLSQTEFRNSPLSSSNRCAVCAPSSSTRSVSQVGGCTGGPFSRFSSQSLSPRVHNSGAVIPFRVTDQLTASAMRRRYRSQSTKTSRGFLLQRALELDKKENGYHVDAALATSLYQTIPASTHSLLGDDVGVPFCQRAHSSSMKVIQKRENSPEELAKIHHATADRDWALHAKGLADVAVRLEEILVRSPKKLSDSTSMMPTSHPQNCSGMEETESRDSIVKALPQNVYQNSFEHFVSEKSVDVTKSVGNVATISTFADPALVIPHGGCEHEILFVDHHIDDDQMSSYGILPAQREDFDPHVLPDWNESRKRFAPLSTDIFQMPL